MLPILAAVLAFITIGGLGWAFVGGGDSSDQALKRAQTFAGTSSGNAAARGDAPTRASALAAWRRGSSRTPTMRGSGWSNAACFRPERGPVDRPLAADAPGAAARTSSFTQGASAPGPGSRGSPAAGAW